MRNKIIQILQTNKEKVTKMQLPIVMGVDSKNKPEIVDLAKVRNILVYGASGQGKTNLLHAFAQSCFYAPPRGRAHIVYYINLKGGEMISPYFDIQLSEKVQIHKELDMLWDKIAKREADKKLSRYPIAILIDDIDHLVPTDESLLEKIEYITIFGPRVGIYTVLTTARMESDIISERLRLETPARVAFRVATADESRAIICSSDATELADNGEILFRNSQKFIRLQPIKVL